MKLFTIPTRITMPILAIAALSLMILPMSALADSVFNLQMNLGAAYNDVAAANILANFDSTEMSLDMQERDIAVALGNATTAISSDTFAVNIPDWITVVGSHQATDAETGPGGLAFVDSEKSFQLSADDVYVGASQDTNGMVSDGGSLNTEQNVDIMIDGFVW